MKLIDALEQEGKTDKEIVQILKQVEEAGQEIATQIQQHDGLGEIAHEVMSNAGIELYDDAEDVPEYEELISSAWMATGRNLVVNNTPAR